MKYKILGIKNKTLDGSSTNQIIVLLLIPAYQSNFRGSDGMSLIYSIFTKQVLSLKIMKNFLLQPSQVNPTS